MSVGVVVDLVGTLHFWDVTIDVVSCVNVVLATGLSVDYSVHIANAFSSSEGSAASRTRAALTSLGPAVFNGGVTTLLAVIVLPFSRSHIFVTFFEVFGLTVFYGLFHGLVLLPVLLTTLGLSEQNAEDKSENESDAPQNEAKTKKSDLRGIDNETFISDKMIMKEMDQPSKLKN